MGLGVSVLNIFQIAFHKVLWPIPLLTSLIATSTLHNIIPGGPEALLAPGRYGDHLRFPRVPMVRQADYRISQLSPGLI